MNTYKVTIVAATDVYFNGMDEDDIKAQYDRMLAGGVPINVLEQIEKALRIDNIEKVR